MIADISHDTTKSNQAKNLSKALYFLKSRQIESSENLCQHILQEDKNNIDALLLLFIISKLKNDDRAANKYINTISNGCESNSVKIKAASMAIAAEKLSLAESICLDIIEDDKDNLRALTLLGNIYYKSGDYNKAAGYYQKCLLINNSDVISVYNLGSVHARLNNLEEALKLYQQTLNLRSDFHQARLRLGQLYLDIGDPYLAEKSFVECLKHKASTSKASSHLNELRDIWLKPISGRHVTLNRCNKEHTNFILHCFSDSDFMRLYNRSLTVGNDIANLASRLEAVYLQHPLERNSIDWVVIDKRTNNPIGVSNLAQIDSKNRKAEFLIGYPKSTRKSAGHSIEATLLILDFAFNKTFFNKIYIKVYENNTHAHKTSLSLGFVNEGFLREQVLCENEGRILGIYYNGMTKSDFRTNKRLSNVSIKLLGKDITKPRSWHIID